MKIRILHVQETIQSGGVERCRLSLAKHLDKNVFEQKFVCTHAIGNIPEEIRREGFEVLSIGTLKSPLDWSQHKKVQKIIDEYQPDIIHGAVFEGVTMAAINGWLKRVPSVIIEETSDPKSRSWRGNFLMKIFSGMSHKVIGVSPSVTEEYLLGKLNLAPGKVTLVNNGVVHPREVSEKEVTDAKMKWGIKNTDFVIGTVGRMRSDEIKRFSDLIKAFALFSKGKNNIKLIMVGGTEEFLQKYQDLAEELEVTENIIFTEYQSDVTLFYKLMDVFSLVSAYEAFGLVLAEAMLNTLPVVATRVGGMKYIVNDGETGVLVESKNVVEIAAAFDRLYSDPELRKRMGEKGFTKAINEYTEEVYVKNISNLYQSLVPKY